MEIQAVIQSALAESLAITPADLDSLVLVDKWRQGITTEADRSDLMEECRRRGVCVSTYEFSNVKVEGVSRRDAGEWLFELTRKKAFAILQRAFGATARFRYGVPDRADPVVDFYWSKALLAVLITGPIHTLPFSNDKAHRARKWDLDFARSLGMLPGIPKNGVQRVDVPYYRVWHNPVKFVEEIREKLLASGAYPRLKKHQVSRHAEDHGVN